MQRILAIKKEHHEIERILLTLEEILDKENLDYNSFKRNFNKLIDLLAKHEKKEDPLFEELKKIMDDSEMKKKFQHIDLIHRMIKGHVKIIKDAMKSKKKTNLKIILENDGRMLISKIRSHIRDEEIIFERVLFLNLLAQKNN